MIPQCKSNHLVICAAERSFKEAYGYKYQGIVSPSKGIYSDTPIGVSPGAAVGVTEYPTMNFSPSFIVNSLRAIREPIVDYQEGRGVPRSE